MRPITLIATFTSLILFLGCNSGASDSSNENSTRDLPFNNLILSERVKGPAEVYDEVQSYSVMNLYDYAIVESHPLNNGWNLIGFWIDLSKTPVEDNQLWPETKIITVDGYEIGEVTAAFQLDMVDEQEAYVRAMIQTENIRTELLPETILSNLINNEKTNIGDYKNFLNNFAFENSGEIDGYYEYFIYESSIEDPSPRDRITLLFESDNLIGVVHSRNLNVPDFETLELIRGHKLTVVSDLTEDEINALANNKINYYNSID